jgi:tungstate transport system substrate-binding protein
MHGFSTFVPMKRRALAFGLAALPFGAALAQASRRADPLRLGVDQALVRAGLAGRIQRAFTTQTGLAMKTTAGPSAGLLNVLEAGDLDLTLTLAPERELRLVQDGLAHDRHTVAELEFLLAGPRDKKAGDPAHVAGMSDIGAALAQLAAAGAPFLGHSGGSGAHLLEQSLWRAAHVEPVAPWFRAMTDGETDELALAASEHRYVLTDRARWLAGGATEFSALVQGDARLMLPAQVMRSFRRPHAAAKLFVGWLGERAGQMAIKGTGVRAVPFASR